MKVLTSAQMREIDRRTVELGIPGIMLMENAGHRVAEFLAETFAPLSSIASPFSAARATTAATAWWSRGSSTPACGPPRFTSCSRATPRN